MSEHRRFAVTGAGGFLGAALVRRLLDEGHEVRALVRPQSRNGHRLDGLSAPGPSVHAADLESPATLNGAFEGTDVVIHAAARAQLRDGRAVRRHQRRRHGHRADVG